MVWIYFNSQPHEEADNVNYKLIMIYEYFNSQPHEEADTDSKYLTSGDYHFNSQPHEEADVNHIKIIYHIVTFQLTASRRG